MESGGRTAWDDDGLWFIGKIPYQLLWHHDYLLQPSSHTINKRKCTQEMCLASQSKFDLLQFYFFAIANCIEWIFILLSRGTSCSHATPIRWVILADAMTFRDNADSPVKYNKTKKQKYVGGGGGGGGVMFSKQGTWWQNLLDNSFNAPQTRNATDSLALFGCCLLRANNYMPWINTFCLAAAVVDSTQETINYFPILSSNINLGWWVYSILSSTH